MRKLGLFKTNFNNRLDCQYKTEYKNNFRIIDKCDGKLFFWLRTSSKKT